MRRCFSVMMSVLILLSNLSCSVNILSNFADTTTNEALFVDSQLLVNKGDYDGALTKIGLMSAEFRALDKVKVVEASAYGGLCGFNFMNFAEALPNMTGTLFEFVLSTFKNGTPTSIANCVAAEDTIMSVATPTDDHRLFLALVSFATIGNILSYYTVATPGDATADPAYDACSNGGAPDMPDSQAQQVGASLMRFYNALNSMTSTVTLGGDQFTALQAICTTIGGATCSKTDPADFDATETLALRSVITTTEIGLGLSTGATPIPPGNACPGGLDSCACF